MPSTMSSYLVCRPVILGLAKVLLLGLGQLPTVQGFPVHVSFLFNTSKDDDVPKENPSTLMYLAVAAALVLLGGAFAGLTIALMGQDEVYLQVIRDSGEGKEKRNAGKVLRLLKRGKHWVLVTLLLGNVITNETLPIILDRSLGGGWPAVLGSTVLIVIFGEIVPQSVCVRYGLPIGAWMSPFVLVLMYILSPVAWPTAKLLDFLLGEDHGTVYKKSGLKTLVSLHRSIGEAGQRLHPDEVTIITAVLDLKDKSVGTVMTPMDDVFTLSLDDVLDEATMDDILSKGYSRIPVHHPDNDENFIGMLLVKILITYDPEDAKPVRDFALATLPETRPDTSCLDVLNYFQEGKSHMLLVSNHPGEDHGAIGVVTLEDVIEELIGEEIIDESDVFLDVHKAIRRLAPAPRTRIPKTGLATDKAPLRSATGDLIDIAEEGSLDAAELQRTGTNEDAVVKAKEMAQRRLSANSGSFDIRIGKRASIDEVKEHLKHLGPSNLASRPKATRYASVKIKPGTDARAPPVERQTPIRRVSENATEFAAGVGEGIVPDGGKAASDAVQALRQDYGTLSTSPNQKRPTSANKGIQAEVDGHSTGVANSENKDKTHTKPSAQTNSNQNSLSKPPANRKRSKSPFYRHKGPARSGSITENIIDTNGIRKVVLETTSSSDSNDEEENSGANKHHEDFRRTSSHRSGSSTTPHVTIDKHGDNNHGENGTTVKKKRRRKKRAVKGEHEPLLREED